MPAPSNFSIGLHPLKKSDFTSRDEENSFERDFSAFAREIIDNAETNSNNIVGYLGTLGVTLTSYSLTSSETWPLIT